MEKVYLVGGSHRAVAQKNKPQMPKSQKFGVPEEAGEHVL